MKKYRFVVTLFENGITILEYEAKSVSAALTILQTFNNVKHIHEVLKYTKGSFIKI